MLKGRKGQFLVVSLLATFMTMLAFVALYPIMKTYIDNAVAGCTTYVNGTTVCAHDMDVYSATLLQLAPFFILISILLTIVFASLPVKE